MSTHSSSQCILEHFTTPYQNHPKIHILVVQDCTNYPNPTYPKVHWCDNELKENKLTRDAKTEEVRGEDRADAFRNPEGRSELPTSTSSGSITFLLHPTSLTVQGVPLEICKTTLKHPVSSTLPCLEVDTLSSTVEKLKATLKRLADSIAANSAAMAELDAAMLESRAPPVFGVLF